MTIRATPIARSLSNAESTVSKHYTSHTVSSYESSSFYSNDKYTAYLKRLVQRKLGLSPGQSSIPDDCFNGSSVNLRNRRLLDLGGGTGNFTRMIVEDVSDVDSVVVDPFLSNNDQLTNHQPKKGSSKKLYFVKAGAEDFMLNSAIKPWWQSNYDQCLIKEAIHHLKASERVPILSGIHQGLKNASSSSLLPPGLPSLLIITRPQLDIDYPLWPAARDVWAQNQPVIEDIKADLAASGFTNIKHSIERYQFETELKTWIAMIKNRFWSTFSNFTNEELEDGCKVISDQVSVNSDGKIQFEDRLVFITADK